MYHGFKFHKHVSYTAVIKLKTWHKSKTRLLSSQYS